MNQSKNEEEILAKIKNADELIERTMWDALRNQDHDAELRGYEQARQALEALSELSPSLKKERDRVLAFCLMRIDDALVRLGDKGDSVSRVKHALQVAQRSQDNIQIARCLLALGTRLASAGSIAEAESYWDKTLSLAEGRTERDMRQIVGWTLIVKGRFQSQTGEAKIALETLERAEGTLEAIDNYAGMANADALMAEIYRTLKDNFNEKKYREKSRKFMEKAQAEEK
jgi:tetratricopeptide (TPR) repeat protein